MRCADVPEPAQHSRRVRLGAERLLSFAAAPTFALMALVTGLDADAMPGMQCGMAQGTSPLTGMALMYLLMSAFHSRPWLGLVRRPRSGARSPQRQPGSAHG